MLLLMPLALEDVPTDEEVPSDEDALNVEDAPADEEVPSEEDALNVEDEPADEDAPCDGPRLLDVAPTLLASEMAEVATEDETTLEDDAAGPEVLDDVKTEEVPPPLEPELLDTPASGSPAGPTHAAAPASRSTPQARADAMATSTELGRASYGTSGR